MIAPTTRWARNFTPRWQPQNNEAAELLADSFEQLGYTPISEKPAAGAAKASKSKVRFDPPKEEKTMAEVAFMITQKQKRQLIEELGYSEEEVRKLT